MYLSHDNNDNLMIPITSNMEQLDRIVQGFLQYLSDAVQWSI